MKEQEIIKETTESSYVFTEFAAVLPLHNL